MKIGYLNSFNVLLFMSIFLFSCDNTRYENRNDETVDRNIAQPEMDVLDDQSNYNAQENDFHQLGKVNTKIQSYVKEGHKTVDEFIQRDGKDFQILAQDLKNINQKIDRINKEETNQDAAFSKWLKEQKTLISELNSLNEMVVLEEEKHAKEIVFNIKALYEDFERHVE